MSLFDNKLKQLAGQEIVVVMVDNRAFRGTLVDSDPETIILRNVVEALPNNTSGWEEPTSSTGVVHKVVTWQGTFSHEDTNADVVRLKDVVINVRGVLRIWEWNLANLQKPEHVEHADSTAPRHGTRISKRG